MREAISSESITDADASSVAYRIGLLYLMRYVGREY